MELKITGHFAHERVLTDKNNIYKSECTALTMKGNDIIQTTTPQQEQQSSVFTKRIGSTNYRVAVHFSETSRETVNDKIMRLIKNDANGKAAGE